MKLTEKQIEEIRTNLLNTTISLEYMAEILTLIQMWNVGEGIKWQIK